MRSTDIISNLANARSRLGKPAILAFVIGLALLGVTMLGGGLRSEPASAASGGPEMALSVNTGSGGFCNGNDCYAEVGSSFELSVEVVTAPAAGYVAMQTYIDYGFTYDPAASEDGAGPNTCSDGEDNGAPDPLPWWPRYISDGRDRNDVDCITSDLIYNERAIEEEIIWPDGQLRVKDARWPGRLNHGATTSFIPPLPVSSYEGRVVVIQMTCPAAPIQQVIDLIPIGADLPGARTSGAAFAERGQSSQVGAKVNSITVNCVSSQPFPGDTDGDGCADARELGSDVTLGGQRDWLDPWDFYDTNGDGVIDLLFDVLGVVRHVGAAPDPPYDFNYDRGPAVAPYGGPNVRDMTEPDGVIDLLNDILGVLAQNGHDCT